MLFDDQDNAKKAEKRKAETKSPVKKEESSPPKRGRGRPKGSTKKGSTKAAKSPKAKVTMSIFDLFQIDLSTNEFWVFFIVCSIKKKKFFI